MPGHGAAEGKERQGAPRSAKEHHGAPRSTTEHHGVPWSAKEHHGAPRSAKEHHGARLDCKSTQLFPSSPQPAPAHHNSPQLTPAHPHLTARIGACTGSLHDLPVTFDDGYLARGTLIIPPLSRSAAESALIPGQLKSSFVLALPSRASEAPPASAERSHFCTQGLINARHRHFYPVPSALTRCDLPSEGPGRLHTRVEAKRLSGGHGLKHSGRHARSRLRKTPT